MSDKPKTETWLIDENIICQKKEMQCKAPIKLTLKVNGSHKAITPKSSSEKFEISEKVSPKDDKINYDVTSNRKQKPDYKRSSPKRHKNGTGFWDKLKYKCIKKNNERYLYEQKKKDGLRARSYREKIRNDNDYDKKRDEKLTEKECKHCDEDLLLSKFNSYGEYCNYYLKKYFTDLEGKISAFLKDKSSIHSKNLIYLTENSYTNSTDFLVNDLSQLLINQIDGFSHLQEYYYIDSLIYYLKTEWRNDTWVTPRFSQTNDIWENLLGKSEYNVNVNDLKPPGDEDSYQNFSSRFMTTI